MEINFLFSGVAVSDFTIARAWYENFFGRPADVLVHDHEDMWRLGEGAFVYVVSDRERAGHSLVSMSVSNLDKTLGEIESRGISKVTIETNLDAGRKATVFDPDGNSIALIELLADNN